MKFLTVVYIYYSIFSSLIFLFLGFIRWYFPANGTRCILFPWKDPYSFPRFCRQFYGYLLSMEININFYIIFHRKILGYVIYLFIDWNSWIHIRVSNITKNILEYFFTEYFLFQNCKIIGTKKILTIQTFFSQKHQLSNERNLLTTTFKKINVLFDPFSSFLLNEANV